MPRTFLGFGGNVGNVAATFALALEELQQRGSSLRVIRTSSLYQTAAIGEKAGDDFLNAVVEIDTDLSPHDLLKLTQSVETSLGRTHTLHWGPRPLDIDILLYGQETIDDPVLIIPHPALWYRRFVLDPLVEIAPDVKQPNRATPGSQCATISELRERMLIRPFRLNLAGPDFTRCKELLVKLRSRFPEIEFSSGETEGLLAHAKKGAELVAYLNRADTVRAEKELATDIAHINCLTVPDNEDRGFQYLSAVTKAATDTPAMVEGSKLTADS